jgi:hypothetical protein
VYNPTRRNRNIGTAQQGYGQHNQLSIPDPYLNSLSFYERLGAYEKIIRVINGHTFMFIIEAPGAYSRHACSIEDVARMISYIPPTDYGDLKFIVFRQPKRKEELLSTSWGRLIYSYEFEGNYYPAIILEAADYKRKMKWKRSLCIEDQHELERLKADGHQFVADKRCFTATLEEEHVRNTQLYRTLPHEFGHYVQYLEIVERPFMEGETEEESDRRTFVYSRLSKECKEKYAHQYADRLIKVLGKAQLIPFQQEVSSSFPKQNEQKQASPITD